MCNHKPAIFLKIYIDLYCNLANNCVIIISGNTFEILKICYFISHYTENMQRVFSCSFFLSFFFIAFVFYFLRDKKSFLRNKVEMSICIFLFIEVQLKEI